MSFHFVLVCVSVRVWFIGSSENEDPHPRENGKKIWPCQPSLGAINTTGEARNRMAFSTLHPGDCLDLQQSALRQRKGPPSRNHVIPSCNQSHDQVMSGGVRGHGGGPVQRQQRRHAHDSTRPSQLRRTQPKNTTQPPHSKTLIAKTFPVSKTKKKKSALLSELLFNTIHFRQKCQACFIKTCLIDSASNFLVSFSATKWICFHWWAIPHLRSFSNVYVVFVLPPPLSKIALASFSLFPSPHRAHTGNLCLQWVAQNGIKHNCPRVNRCVLVREIWIGNVSTEYRGAKSRQQRPSSFEKKCLTIWALGSGQGDPGFSWVGHWFQFDCQRNAVALTAITRLSSQAYVTIKSTNKDCSEINRDHAEQCSLNCGSYFYGAPSMDPSVLRDHQEI